MRALIIDDHPLIQDAVAHVLRRLDAGADIALANDCEQGFAIAQQGPEPDLVLLDLNLPGLSGIRAVTAWRARFPAVPVIVLSATSDQQTMIAALDAGAAGYIVKASTREVMLNAIRLVQAGGKYVPIEALARSPGGSGPQRAVRATAPALDSLGLTDRQMDVLRLIAQGVSNKTMCRELGLAERTVKAHVTAVLRALKVSSRTQAALAAAKLGLPDQAHRRANPEDATG
jgi:DNA-binding NarL/FixJ family response regulator